MASNGKFPIPITINQIKTAGLCNIYLFSYDLLTRFLKLAKWDILVARFEYPHCHSEFGLDVTNPPQTDLQLL